ncbi:MAG: HDIG domain-containing protein [Euryarchaeota archaeon]|nr:HDIG domain-containing protein [Euryarchaeota archaeon]
MISIDSALEMVDNEIENDNLRKHMLAVSKIMGALAEKRSEGDKEKWILVGLLHDLDYEQTKDNPEMHGLIAAEMIIKEEIQ